MLSIPFYIGTSLSCIGISSMLWELHKETKFWRTNDIELAKKAEQWVSDIKNIFQTNTILLSIESSCRTQPSPPILAALKASAKSLEFWQDHKWKITETAMSLESLKGHIKLRKPQRKLKGLCIKGIFSFPEEIIFQARRHYSGIDIQASHTDVSWSYQHEDVKRRL